LFYLELIDGFQNLLVAPEAKANSITAVTMHPDTSQLVKEWHQKFSGKALERNYIPDC
jgi:hypothetical protein